MADPLVSLRFHGEVPFDAVTRAAADLVAQHSGRPPAPFAEQRTGGLQGVLRLARSLGVAVRISLTAPRLLEAADDPQERKALVDGCARGRLLVVPFPGLSCDPGALAPVEAADEVRLDVDLWKRLLLTPPFTRPAARDTRRRMLGADPAAEVRRLSFTGLRAVELVVPLALLERTGQAAERLARLAEVLRARRDLRFEQPGADPAHGDRILRDILAGSRLPPPWPAEEGFQPQRDAPPVEPLRAAFGGGLVASTIADRLDELVRARFDPRPLEAPLRRCLLLRAVLRLAPPDHVPRRERTRAAVLCALALVQDVLSDDDARAAAGSGDAPALRIGLERCLKRVLDGEVSLPDPEPGADFPAAAAGLLESALDRLEEAGAGDT